MADNSTSNSNIHNIVKAQIVFLLSTLTEENFDRNQLEIRSLSEQHGLGTYLHFIRRLIVHSQGRLSSASNAAFDASTALTFRLLVQEAQRLARDPFLADRFREGVDKGEGDVFRHFDFIRFADRVGLRPLERLILTAAILSTPGGTTRKELAAQAQSVLRVDFENAALALCQRPSFDQGADLTQTQVAKLLANLLTGPTTESPLLDAQQRQALIAAAQTKFGIDAMAPVLQQLLPNISLPPDSTAVQTLLDLGIEVTSDPTVIKGVLGRFGFTEQEPPTTAQVVDWFAVLARQASDGRTLFDVATFIRTINSLRAPVEWAKVIEGFDRPERHVVDTATLKLLIVILLNSPREAEPPAVTGFWTNWTNSLYQLRLLDALLSLPSDTFTFVSLPGRRVVTVDDVASASPTIKALAANVQSSTWNSLDLFEVLVRLSDAESADVRTAVRDMLDKAIKISADIVMMGLLQVGVRPRKSIQQEYTQKLLGVFLGGHPNHQLVFMRIWQIEPTYLTTALRDFYEENPMNITRILDVAQDLKILDSLLDVRPFTFALDVAALASRREYLNLDKWLADNVNTHGAEFLHAVIAFLDLKAQNEKTARTSDPSAEGRTMPLSPQTIAIFLRVLRNGSAIMDERDVDYCLEVRNACLQIHPRLMNLTPGTEQEPGFTVINYSAEIEGEVDSIYKQMYDEQISIDGVIQLLQRAKESTNPRDHEIFSCMLHFLFDEYKFFQSFYPPRELAMTGYLFGSLIQHQLIDYIPLGIAIRYILDALQCPPETNLFKFGIQALSRFESRLPEWTPLCQALLEIPHLVEARPDIIETVHRAIAAAQDGRRTEGLQGFPGKTAPVPEAHPPFKSIQPDHLPDDTIDPPSEELSDKILFIINNLAPSNFDSKTNEMKERFTEEHAHWLANYLVDQRISTEPNNHLLYFRFLSALDRPPLKKYVLHETYVKCAAVLNAEKTISSSSERTILKNLASWLGQITLAQDKPIKFKNISLKDLLIEGVDSNRLIVAIPFVCKVLESAAKSKVFKPPNPWLMAVISLLAELYHFAELKLNLKFEIEVLCKTLELDLDKVDVSSILRDRPLAETGPPLPEYVSDIANLPMGDYDAAQAAPETQVVSISPGTQADTQRALGQQIESILANLPSLIVINPQLGPLNTNQTFKQALALAIDQSVREIILPVVERSVTIAGISTRELVNKDFATEANEDRMRKAAHYTAQKLAGSLALVTCKEPLKTNMASHIRQQLNEHGYTEAVPDEVVHILVQDNIDVTCSAIERAAMDRAVQDVEEAFAASYEARRRHREMRPGQAFWDSSVPQSAFINALPEPLRIKPSGLQPHQLRVYEDFAGVDFRRRQVISRPGSTASFAQNEYTAQSVGYATGIDQEGRQSAAGFLSHADATEQFNLLVADLESVLSQIPYVPFANLPPAHDVRGLLRQILQLAHSTRDRNRTPLAMSQKIVQLLYKTPSQLGREAYVALLEQLCQMFEDVAKEAITWLIYADDERKYNVPVTVTLLRSRLVNISQQDLQWAKSLFSDPPRASLQDFIANLIRECLTADPPIATQAQFANCLHALTDLVQRGQATEAVVQIVEALRGVRRPVAQSQPQSQPTPTPEPSLQAKVEDTLQPMLHKYFLQWVAIFQRSPNPEKAFIPYITQLTKQGVLKAEETSSLFFRVCAEASISNFTKFVGASDYGHAFVALDALSRLIVFIIKYHGDAAGGNNDQAKVHYFTKILSIVVLVLAKSHEEQGMNFQQKPFFRFFSSLLFDLQSVEPHLGTAYFQLLLALSDTFSSLQPTYFPGFTFSWITLISHRLFLPRLLLSENREGWSAFHKLLLSLFKFLAPFLRNADLGDGSRDLYRGTLRLLLVLLHDFPEFLSEYYFTLCDAIPPRCIQLRNIILSAFPPSISLPDPHLRNFKFETIPEMGPIPPILSDFTSALKPSDLRSHLDQFLLNRGTQASLSTLKDRLRLPNAREGEESYNLSLMNAVVMYIGVSSVAQAKARSGSSLFVSTDPGVAALTYLAMHLDPEGQHHLLSSMVLHLRYPNAHTHWFSSLLLFLFTEVKDEKFREIVTKVLLERFVVHRPHPWGALVTFIELVRNQKYEFWSRDFIRVAPEVTLLLESVARSVFVT